MDWSIVRQGLPFCLEMFLALSLYLQPLKRREGFWLRVAASALLFVLTLLGYGLAVQELDMLWFVLIFLVTIGMGRFCCLISWTDALYAASLAYAAQHIASTLYILLVFRGAQPQWSDALYIVVDLLVFAAAFFPFARKLPEQGEYRVTANTAVTLSALVLFTALFLSAFCKRAVDASALVQGEKGYISLFRGSLMFDLLEYDPGAKAIVGYPTRISLGATLRGCLEGPHLYKKNGYYYLLCAEGGTGYYHCATLSRARDIFGPYAPCPHNPLISAVPENRDESADTDHLKPRCYNDYLMAKSQKAFRRAALRRSKTAGLFCQIVFV